MEKIKVIFVTDLLQDAVEMGKHELSKISFYNKNYLLSYLENNYL